MIISKKQIFQSGAPDVQVCASMMQQNKQISKQHSSRVIFLLTKEAELSYRAGII